MNISSECIQYRDRVNTTLLYGYCSLYTVHAVSTLAISVTSIHTKTSSDADSMTSTHCGVFQSPRSIMSLKYLQETNR